MGGVGRKRQAGKLQAKHPHQQRLKLHLQLTKGWGDSLMS